ILVAEGKYKEAIPKLLQAKNLVEHLPPFRDNVRRLLVQAYEATGNKREAEKILKEGTSDPLALLRLAQLEMSKGRNAEALRIYRKIAEGIDLDRLVQIEQIWRPF